MATKAIALEIQKQSIIHQLVKYHFRSWHKRSTSHFSNNGHTLSAFYSKTYSSIPTTPPWDTSCQYPQTATGTGSSLPATW